jgi:hypothetical protein
MSHVRQKSKDVDKMERTVVIGTTIHEHHQKRDDLNII